MMQFLKGTNTTEEESSSDRANTGGSTSACSALGSGGGRGVGTRCRWAAVGSGSRRCRTSFALGFLLEGIEGLFCGRVDGEDHSGFAMGASLAVEPGWGGAIDGVVVRGRCGGTNSILTIGWSVSQSVSQGGL